MYTLIILLIYFWVKKEGSDRSHCLIARCVPTLVRVFSRCFDGCAIFALVAFDLRVTTGRIVLRFADGAGDVAVTACVRDFAALRINHCVARVSTCSHHCSLLLFVRRFVASAHTRLLFGFG